jgi:glycosyltransferase involved in cell wall biosynthesis
MSRRLTFVGPINAFTGYGLHSIAIIQGLMKRGVHVSVRALSFDESMTKVPDGIRQLLVNSAQPEEWELLLNPPCVLPTPGKKTAYFTMWESTIVRPPGVQMMNRAECVIVPCQWNASCFSAQGVTRPIHIVPLGIEEKVFIHREPNRFPAEDRPPVVFGTAARARHGGVRKGLQETISVFQKAFPDGENVKLKIKCFDDDPEIDMPSDSRIILERRYMSTRDLSEWFGSIDVFLSMSRGEGWGLMQQQAMATGRPVIAARFGGLAEFMTDRNSFCVPFRMEETTGGYAGMGVWAVPNEDAVVSIMRRIAERPWEAESKGALAAVDAGLLSWDNSIDELVKVLEKEGAI